MFVFVLSARFERKTVTSIPRGRCTVNGQTGQGQCEAGETTRDVLLIVLLVFYVYIDDVKQYREHYPTSKHGES